MKRNFILFYLLLFLMVSFSFSQPMKATTKSGERVVLNDNGTWEYIYLRDDIIDTKPNFRKNEINELTGKKIIRMGLRPLFTFDDNDGNLYLMVSFTYLNNKIGAEAFFTTMDNYTSKSLGYISSGKKIQFKTVTGNTVECKFLTSDYKGIELNGRILYKTELSIDNSSLEILKNEKVEEVGIYWSKNYKDYIVTDRGELIRQLHYLYKAISD